MPSTNLGKVSITPKGEYNAQTAYEPLDVISYQGDGYIVLKPVQGVTPVNGDTYMKLVSKGDAGQKGDTGAPGEKGDPGQPGEQGVPGEKGEQGEKGDPFTYADFTPEQLAALKGPKGDKGDKGDTGADGIQGERGEKGEKGDTGKGLTIFGYYSSFEELQSSVPAPQAGDAYGVGVFEPYDIYIYDGNTAQWVNNGALQGAPGAPGDAATIRVGTVSTLPAGTPATVTNSGTANAAVFDFAIPQGEKGEQGERGLQGEQGVPGEKGEKGEPGERGEQGPQGVPGDIGPAGADGKNGATFTPSVDPDGNLSWTNDGGLENPEPVNIKGPKGDTGEKGDTGPAGQDGAQGAAGRDATINGVNALNITATGGIKGQQSGDTYTLDGSGLMEKVSGLQGQFLGFTDENVVGAVDAPAGGAGKRVCRFTVGTSTAGWTEDVCDYLCDGTDDQEEINAAIQALPETGGEIVILDGTYNITASIVLDRANSTLRGNGSATVLKRMWDSSTQEGIVNVSADNCTVCDLCFDGNKVAYTSNNNRGVNISGSKICVTGNTYNNNKSDGIYVSGSGNTITGNTCNDNSSYGIHVRGNGGNTVAGNTCNNNSSYGIHVGSTINHNNTITGNTCNDNGSYGICVSSAASNTITGNTCNNNNCGIYVSGSGNNTTITGNTCLRGTGTTSDYTSSQYTIKISGKNNLVANNNCMGKAPVDSGTGNTLVNNKYE